jgi:hypothetical protein
MTARLRARAGCAWLPRRAGPTDTGPTDTGPTDAGSVSLFVAVAAFAVLVLTGLVVDGSGKIRALQRADATAQEAARAGGQVLALPAAVRGQSSRVQAAAAAAAARGYLRDAGVDGQVMIVDGGRGLHVTTSLSYSPTFLSMIGVGALGVTGRADARLVRGVFQEQP